MSVYIKGMKMPTSWRDCLFSNGGAQCKLAHMEICDKLHPHRYICPLIPVPEHGDLIDRDALNIHDTSPAYGFCVMGVTEEDIYDAPTIIPADLVKEGE